MDKKQRKHEMLLTFLDHAYAGNNKKKRKKSSVSIKHTILLLLGTV
jgi:hypothetical protein